MSLDSVVVNNPIFRHAEMSPALYPLVPNETGNVSSTPQRFQTAIASFDLTRALAHQDYPPSY